MVAALTSALLAANAALLLCWFCLALFDWVLVRAGLGQAWTLRRRLVAGAWVISLALPVCLAVLPALPVNATDWLVAEYLRGNTALTRVSATELAQLIEARDSLPRTLAEAPGPMWQGLCAIFLVVALYRLVRVVQSALLVRRAVNEAETARVFGRLRIATSLNCSVPFATTGLWRHHVILPARVWANPTQRRMALTHELQHLRQRDPALEVAMALLSPLFALNPAFWALARRTRRLREHGCDAACVARAGVETRDYAMCLLEVAREARARGPGLLTIALLGRRQRSEATTRSQLGQRIEWIAAGPERQMNGFLTFALVVVFTATTLGTMLLLRAPDSWSHERLMLSSVVNLERLETINTLSQRPLR